MRRGTVWLKAINNSAQGNALWKKWRTQNRALNGRHPDYAPSGLIVGGGIHVIGRCPMLMMTRLSALVVPQTSKAFRYQTNTHYRSIPKNLLILNS